MNFTKRIIKFMLVAAIALPAWHASVAQNRAVPPEMAPTENQVREKAKDLKGHSVATTNAESRPVGKPASLNAKRGFNLGTPSSKARVSKAPKGPKVQGVQPVKAVNNEAKTGQPRRTTVPKLKASELRTDVPEGYALIVFVANDVWGDGSGYQMLIDQNATMYASWNSNGISQSIYDMAEYTIPENADYNASGNATNFLVSQTGQVAVPAGTYDILITNPTPDNKVYVANTNGNIGGRIDDYTITAGKVYTFTVSMGSDSHDQTDVEITSVADALGDPTNLVADPSYTSADISWEAGINNEGWNLRYRPYVDVKDYNRLWDFPVADGTTVSTGGWMLYDNDGDGNNWDYVATTDSNPITDACLYSQSWISGTGALTPDNWAISPEVKLGGTLKFKARTNGYTEKLGVFVYQGDLHSIYASNLVQVGSDLTLTSSNTTFAEYEYNLGAFDGYGYIIIRHYNCTDGYKLLVDDIQIIVPDNQELPQEAEWTYVNDVTNPYTITGLTNNTTYEVQVQGVGNNTTTDWTASEIFTTLAPTQSLDFGTVDAGAGSSKTLAAKVLNETDSPVTATVTVAPNPPFSVASTEVTLAANALTSIPVTFTPTEARSYNGTLTVIAGNDTTIIKLKGAGNLSGPEAIRDSAFYAGISYSWPINNPTNESDLTEIATDPDQIIAMLREVYMNKDIPGNYVRGYNDNVTSGHYVGPNTDVQYTAAGTIKRDGQYLSFDDTYGWNIPSYKDLTIGTSNSVTYAYMDPTEYKPNYEGVTLLLLEMVDDFDPNNVTVSATGYAGLREYFSKTIKSARVVTQAMRVGEDLNRGTLFNISCDKMNKFYLIAKGQLQWIRNAYMAHKNSTFATSFAYTEPCYIYDGSSYDEYVDESIEKYFFLGHMFEQFSPAMPNATATTADLYKDLVDMKSFNVNHDCPNVPFVENGHHFMMYGTASISSDDCQDVRDLLFFVPDQRMRWWYDSTKDDGRGTESGSYNMSIQDYFEYNQTYAPKMGLFVIKQNTITGEQVSVEGTPTYKLHLTWASNLLDFMPNEDGMYTLYRVITDADGNKTYEVVCEFADPKTLDYYDYVPMQQNGQQVTYVVQGQDKGKFLDLQMSNEESFIIPGLDRAEQLRIALNSDYYFSRYDAGEQKNYYSNSLIANNTVGTNVKPNYIKNGSEFKFWRATLKTVDGATVVDTDNAVNFVTATVENYTETGGGRLRYGNWSDDQVNFSSKPYGHGYHSTPATSNITISGGEVVFSGLKLYDNFSVDVSENAHPSQYVYYVTLHTAVPFDLGTSGVPDCATWQNGKTFAYFECAYGSTMRAWAWNNDGNLTGTTWPGTGTMTKVGTHNGNNVWLWTADASVQPTSIIFNWDNASDMEKTGTYAFTNGGYYKHESDVVSVLQTSQEARSNTVAVPVYKTEMVMKPITAADVEADVDRHVPAATKFDVDARYSSKDDILGYYIYRWADKVTAATARSIYDAEGEDESPQGQAGNQADYYTVAMNTDYTAETEHFVMDANGRYPDVTATFVDNFMVNDAKDADTYTYAPVVELFAPHGAKVLNETTLNPTSVDRADYNTYGGPQQMTAGGIVNLSEPANIEASDYTFTETADGKTGEFAYYNIPLGVTVDVPDGFDIYMVRAWRLIDEKYLGEEKNSNYTDRAVADYLFETNDDTDVLHFNQVGETRIGTQHGAPVLTGTFGAKKLSAGESFDAKFIVRVYFTRKASTSTLKATTSADGKYYIAEAETTVTVKDVTYTSVNDVNAKQQVAGVKYYNVAGIESDKPFDGINIVVTRYTDGSVVTRKEVK